MKTADDALLAGLVREQFVRQRYAFAGCVAIRRHLGRPVALFKDRCATTVELADWLSMYVAADVRSPLRQTSWPRS